MKEKLNNLENEIKFLRDKLSQIEKRKRIKLYIGIATIILIPLTIWAATITKPYTFTAGKKALASQVNANFDALYAKVNELDVKVDGKLGTYCGKTATTFTGSAVGGYTGAKAKCQGTCSTSSVHLCTAHEVIISLQNGLTLPASLWVATATWAQNSVGNNVTDCNSWTDGTVGLRGNTWTGTTFSIAGCAASQSLACCE